MANPTNSTPAKEPMQSPRLKARDSSIPPAGSTSPFFRLPTEIRLDIYDLVLSDLTFDTKIRERITPSLLYTNKVIRGEITKPYARRLVQLMREKKELWKHQEKIENGAYDQNEQDFAAGAIADHDYLKEFERIVAQKNARLEEMRRVSKVFFAEMEALKREREEGVVVAVAA